MKKLISLALACTMMSMLFVGCGASEETTTEETTTTETTETTEETTPADGSYTIGYAINSLNDTGQTFALEGAQQFADENGHELVVVDATEDVIKQQDNVSALIEQGVDALVVVAVDTSAMDPITQMAVDAGVPLAYINRNPYGGQEASLPEGVFYIGSEEFDAGKFQAEYVGEVLGGTGKVAIVQGMLGNEAALKRTEGFEVTAAELYPDLEVVAKEVGNWQRDQGMSVTENLITKYGDELSAVIANNDEMALGAVNALQSAGMDDVIVMGVDATPDALAAVADGTLDGTVLQNLHAQGYGGVEKLASYVSGEEVEAVTWIPFELVTPENLADYQ